MFLATRAARSGKLRRSGMFRAVNAGWVCEAKSPSHVAPTELGGAFGTVATINMALLTELDRSPQPKMSVQ